MVLGQSQIRNFCTIAHIDHGKSTLADRLLELTETVGPRQMRDQVLDGMDLEREKGVTIKLSAVRMAYHPKSYGSQLKAGYILNLIDTPGHVDFSYEVSRSLAACEGALLLVDASQGIQAQTLANLTKAQELGLMIIPMVNKIDLPDADSNRVAADLASLLGVAEDEVLHVSAKEGTGVAAVLEAVIKRIPAPPGDVKAPLQALVFDSFYDEHRGVIALIRIFEGTLRKGDSVKFLQTNASAQVVELGWFAPGQLATSTLRVGEVGYIVTGLKDLSQVQVGDTLTTVGRPGKLLPGARSPQPVVFAGLYPLQAEEYESLREALEKLRLTDASFTFEPERSGALGSGFRLGFLGTFHAEIIRERLLREFKVECFLTTPSVRYRIERRDGSIVEARTPGDFGDFSRIKRVLEPWVRVDIYTPPRFLGLVMELNESHRGKFIRMDYRGSGSVKTACLKWELPLKELIVGFYDELKSCSSGFASLSYEFLDYREADLVKLSVLVHHEPVEAFSQIVLKSEASRVGRQLVKRLKEILPRQQFPVALQAAVGGTIVARETTPALRKNVLAGIYGGHRERKDKLLQRQKAGKKKMMKIGQINIPPETFRQVFTPA